MIGIVMLIGLSAKSAILIVEFAKVRREAGLSADVAALEAARIRFRAVIMMSVYRLQTASLCLVRCVVMIERSKVQLFEKV